MPVYELGDMESEFWVQSEIPIRLTQKHTKPGNYFKSIEVTEGDTAVDFVIDPIDPVHLAAPDLLEACELAVERLEINNIEKSEQVFIDQLEAVIKKAKGE